MIRFLSPQTIEGGMEQSAEDFLGSSIVRHSGDRLLKYKEVNGQELLISLYEPLEYDPGQKYPLLVFLHGGGWHSRKIFHDQSGWAGDYLGFLARHFANQGCLCASIDYRLLRKNGQETGYELIDLYEDCVDAVSYLKTHASEIGIDEKRTAVLGESAGGHLAAALVTLPMGNPSFFHTAILVNAITDLSDPRWSRFIAENSSHPLLKGKSMPEKIQLLSPAMQIGAHTCPTLLLHGTEDSVVFPFHACKFYDLLRACGAEARLDWITKTNHAFLLAEFMMESHTSLQSALTGVRAIEEWLEKRKILPQKTNE